MNSTAYALFVARRFWPMANKPKLIPFFVRRGLAHGLSVLPVVALPYNPPPG